MPDTTTPMVPLTAADCEALKDAIEVSHGEGQMGRRGWPSESLMRAIGFDESHWIWSSYLRNRDNPIDD